MNKQEIIDKYGSVRAAARAMGMAESTLRCRLDRSEMSGKNVGESVGEEVCEALSNQNRLSEAKQPKKDALTAICDAMGILPEEVAGGWLRDEKATIRVKRTQTFVPQELTPQFVELLDSARRHVLRGPESSNADTMLVICPVDAHFGKLSYSGETEESYDVNLAAKIYRQAVSDALTHFSPARVKKVVLVLGSDQMHCDSADSKTSSGTIVQSVDTRYSRVFDIAVASSIAAIEDCVQIADVHAVCVPGNHDMLTSVLLAKVVKQYFRHDPRVTVDDDEILRKYIRFGTNLIGLTHRFTKFDTAPVIMATERPKDWGETTCREILTGHLHTTRAKSWTPYHEVSGVVVRITSSLSSTDLWHYANGYIGNIRASETWAYSEEDGMYGMHVAKVRN